MPKKQIDFESRDEDGLTNDERLFIEYYIVDYDAVTASEKIGISRYEALTLLRDPIIKAAITKRKAQLTKKTLGNLQITQGRVLKEYARLAFHNIVDIMITLTDGEYVHFMPGVVPTQALKKLSDDQKACIQELKFKTDIHGITYIENIKLFSKPAALEALAKHTGAFEEDNKQKAPQVWDINVFLNMLPFPPEVKEKMRLEIAKRLEHNTNYEDNSIDAEYKEQ